MRLLMIHADRFSFQVTGKVGRLAADPLAPGDERGAVAEALVAFISVETEDASDPAGVARETAMRLAAAADKVGATRIMIYPYAHLSSSLAEASVAKAVLSDLFNLVRSLERYEALRAPFGYYKSFEISCKGHPLSELSMTIGPAEHEPLGGTVTSDSVAIAAERTIRSEWRIYGVDGSFVPAGEFKFADHQGLRDLYTYETAGTRAAEDSPPHIKLMREHELVDYEPASDTGNLRWYPKGVVIKRSLEQHATNLAVNHGAMEVETPIMYDYEHHALAKYLNRFPARQYVVRSDDKEFFLRFAACFGQYMIQHDMTCSYRDLPMRLYELTHYSFRREQGGELAGLRRLRAFTMPDMHSLVRNIEMAKTEFLSQVTLCLRWLDDLGIECVPAIRFVRSFLDDDPKFIADLMGAIGRPALVEVWDDRFFYFVAKFEMNFIDMAKKAACLSTVQIDVENTERFGIVYTTESGEKKHPLLMHTSISGSIDRNLYALLEDRAIKASRGIKATWPTWLAPTQIRLLPVSDTHISGAMALAARMPFRVDVDDRDMKLGKKVRQAEKEWVPYTLVIGERELAGDTLTVRPRTGEQFDTTLDAFLEQVRAETAGMPLTALNTPPLLSSRPIFVG